jgi:hypothetical protein
MSLSTPPTPTSATTPAADAVDYAVAPAAGASARLSDHVLAWVDRHRRALFAIILLVYVIGFNPQWRLEPDSALYLSVGRNLAEGKGYTFHGKAHHLAYPGLPVLFAGMFKVFRAPQNGPGQVLMLLMGLAALALVYRLFRLQADRPTAVIVTLGVACTRLFYRYSFELLSDLPFLLGVLMFLVGYEAVLYHRAGRRGQPLPGSNGAAASNGHPAGPRARWFDWAFLIAGLVVAVATRPAMWAMVFAVVLAVLWPVLRGTVRWGQIVAGLAVVGAVVGAVVLFYQHDPRHSATGLPQGPGYVEEDQMFDLHGDRVAVLARRAARNVRVVFDRQVAKAAFGMPLGTPLNFVLNFTVIGLGVALVRVRPLWGMFVLTTVGIVLLVPKPQERYFLPVLPLLVYAWWGGIRWLNQRLPTRWANWAFLGLFALGAVPNGAEVMGFIGEQRYVPFLRNYKEGRYASVYEAAEMVERNTPPSGAFASPQTTWVLVPSKFARIVTYLTGRYAIEPDDGTPVNPWIGGGWQHFYVLEPTDPDKPDPTDKRPTVHEWLAARKFEVVPEVIATVRNKDPGAREPWTLHRIRPMPTEQKAPTP